MLRRYCTISTTAEMLDSPSAAVRGAGFGLTLMKLSGWLRDARCRFRPAIVRLNQEPSKEKSVKMRPSLAEGCCITGRSERKELKE